MGRFDAGERILEISEEIMDLVEEAMELVRREGTDAELARAKGYWNAHIRMSLNEDHDYLGGGGCTMADTAQELMVEEGDEDED